MEKSLLKLLEEEKTCVEHINFFSDRLESLKKECEEYPESKISKDEYDIVLVETRKLNGKLNNARTKIKEYFF